MKRIVFLLIILLTLITSVYAETSITLGISAVEGYKRASNSYEYVYFGKESNNPIKWRVLDTTSNDGVTPALFMLSEYALEPRVFRSDRDAYNANEWYASDVKKYLQGTFMNNSFNLAEQDAIIVTRKSDRDTTDDYGYKLKASPLSREKIFLLSGTEVKNTKYGFSNTTGNDLNRHALYVNNPTGNIVSWWLRSGNTYSSKHAGFVSAASAYTTRLGYAVVNNSTRHIRPALNINPESVLFTSAAKDGKISPTVGDIGIFNIEDSVINEYKLTVLDSARNFTINDVNIIESQGDKISISYSEVTVGSNEYISAMIVDADNLPVYYGRILKIDTDDKKNGSINIIMPEELTDGEYTLKIFSEQYNGDYRTDYASAFRDINLIKESTGFRLKIDNFDIDNTDIVVKKGETIQVPYKDAVITEEGYIGGTLWQDFKLLTKYDKLVSLNKEYGRVELDTSDMELGEYTLRLFPEVYGNEYYSNSDIATNEVKLIIEPADLSVKFSANTIKGYNSDTDSYDYVYFGVHSSGNPIKWRVLDTTSNDGSTPALFMLSEYTLGGHVFRSNREISDANKWEASDVKTYLQGNFINNSFKAIEQDAIIATTKTDDTDVLDARDYILEATNLNNEKVFLLSASEITNTKYGFSSNVEYDWDTKSAYKITDPSGDPVSYWLRSANSYSYRHAGFVGVQSGYTELSYAVVNNSSREIRPALNVNPSSVFFISAAAGDKSAIPNGTIGKLVMPSTTEYKLTLFDTTRSFSINTTGLTFVKGQKTSITYSGANVGTNEYISAFILKDDIPIYYGRIVKPTSQSGTFELTIPSQLEDGEYTLRIFSEQYNGDYKTDYASAFIDIEIDIHANVTYSTDNGIVPNAIKVEYNSKIILPEPKAEGKKFLGWYKSDDTEFTSDEKVTGYITLTAKWEDDTTTNNTTNVADTSDANAPVLYRGLKPIKYGENGEVIFTNASDSDWYNYSAGKWANAVTVDAENNITGYYVWIPRYAYLIRSGYNTSDVGTIDIRFLDGTANKDKYNRECYTIDDLVNSAENWEVINSLTYVGDRQMEYLVHPAFRFNEELPGIWVAKYETGVNLDGQLLSIPNAMLYNNTHIVNGFVSIREMTDNNMYGLSANSHLIKPTEYGAVVYLEESKYAPQEDYKVKGLDEIKEYTSGYLDGRVSIYNDVYMTDEEGNIPDIKGSAYLETSDGETTWYGEAITPLTDIMVKEDRFGTLTGDGSPSEDIGFRIVITK